MAGSAAGLIFDVQRASFHDGPGLRTTVFLKGCPLKCCWCHNPESIRSAPEILFNAESCVGCGRCAEVCPTGCHSIQDGGHRFDREKCTVCAMCVDVCPVAALEKNGRNASVDELMDLIVRDRSYYDRSGGGLTVSGGEPMMQCEFVAALLAEAKREGIHTCVDTSGFVPFGSFQRILDHADLFLYDIKETNPDLHFEYTGVPNELILENVHRLDDAGKQIILRCPVIPGLNDRADHFLAIKSLANSLSHVLEVNVMPFHPFGGSKRKKLGKSIDPRLPTSAASPVAVREWRACLSDGCRVPVA
jgi:pyruvate formate lyase activating enzyme